MLRPSLAGVATVLLAASLAAQVPTTAGVPGINDLTIDGQGSNTTSCTTVIDIVGGTAFDSAITSHPDAPLVGVVATHCVPNALTINPWPVGSSGTVYVVDVDLASMEFAFDGTATFLSASPFTPFFKTNALGDFNVFLTTTEPPGQSFATQVGIISPAFVMGIGVTQAHTVNIVPGTLCPGTIGGDLSPLTDDGSVSISLSSAFTFYGTSYSTVFVNMNGSMTFNAGDADATASSVDLLAGNPRIAPAWDDWDPSDPTQGTVRLNDTGTVVELEWHDVRHAGAGCANGVDTNSFCASLDLVTGQIAFSYAGMMLCLIGTPTSTDQVVGISPGLGLSAALSVDLTSSPAGVPGAAQFEDFGLVVPAPGVSSFDLSHQTTIWGQRVVFTPSAGAYDVSLVSLP